MCEIARTEYFTQATTNRADTAHAVFYELSAFVIPAYEGSVLSATITWPSRQEYAMTNDSGQFMLLNASGDAVNLSAAAPSGTYRFQVQCASQGMQTVKVSMPGPATGIPPLRVANFEALQGVDASQPFGVFWDKVADKSANDYLELHIIDASGNEVFTNDQIRLDETNVTIPAGTLAPDSTNNAYLALIHLFAMNRGPKMPPWVTFERRDTWFKIITLNPAGVFRFSPLCVTANESAGPATMTVQRTQGSAGQVTVDYYSTDATARSNVNYTAVSGTLVFADGQTNQTFTVPLLNDGVTNPPLTVHLTLTNATGGAALDLRPHAILTILDSQSAPGPNVNACVLAKVEFYDQTNAAPPLQADRSLTSRFFAEVQPKFPGGVTDGTVTLPNGSVRKLGYGFENYQAFVEYDDDLPSPACMNSLYRPGKYKVTYNTCSQGAGSAVLTLGTERVFSVAWVTNWTEAQSIDPSQAFELRWTPFVGATTNDYVQVAVRNGTGEYVLWTPDEFEPGGLPGATASVSIPANTLDFGSQYWVNIIFVKMISPATDPRTGIHTGIAFMHTTGFYVNTVPAP